MRARMKFFDGDFRMITKKDRGRPIWDVELSYLRWMLENGREGMGPLEVDIIRAFIAERKRLCLLYKQKEQHTEEKADQMLEAAVQSQFTDFDTHPPLSSEEKEMFDALFA